MKYSLAVPRPPESAHIVLSLALSRDRQAEIDYGQHAPSRSHYICPLRCPLLRRFWHRPLGRKLTSLSCKVGTSADAVRETGEVATSQGRATSWTANPFALDTSSDDGSIYSPTRALFSRYRAAYRLTTLLPESIQQLSHRQTTRSPESIVHRLLPRTMLLSLVHRC